MNYLNGYKTHILVAGAVALWLGIIFGQWTLADVDVLFGLIGTLTVSTIAHKIDKVSK
jgi:hypothetical protein